MTIERNLLKPGIRESEHKPDGSILCPVSALLALDAGKQDFQTYKPHEIYPLLLPVLTIMTKYNTFMRASSVTDVMETLEEGLNTREMLKGSLSKNNPGDIISSSKKIRSFINKMLEGSDFDYRVELPPEFTMQNWHIEVVDAYRELSSDIQTQNLSDGTQITDVYFDEKIFSRHFNLMNALTFNWYFRPVVRITYGKWPNEIPFCNIEIFGKGKNNKEMYKVVDMGFAPTPSSMPTDIAAKDTRSSNAVNSRDRLLIPIVADIPESHKYALTYWLNPGKFVDEPNKIPVNKEFKMASPSLGGKFKNGRSFTISLEINGKKHELTEPYMYIPADIVEQLHAPIEFGSEFGTRSAAETFLEFLRIHRKAYRIGSLANNENTTRAISIIMDPEFRNKLMTESTDWKDDAQREIATSLFYAPFECIQDGIKYKYAEIFPNWKYLEELLSSSDFRLPSKDTLKTLMHDLLANSITKKFMDLTHSWDIIARGIRYIIIKETRKQFAYWNNLRIIYLLTGFEKTDFS